MSDSPLVIRGRRARRAIFSIAFVWHHVEFFIVLALGLVVGILLVSPIILPGLLDYFPVPMQTLFASPGKVPINAFIFLLTFFGGMAKAALVLSGLHREMAILGASQRKIDTAKRQWAKEYHLSWALEDGLTNVLPTGAGIEEPRESTTGRMVAAILADAKDLRFDPIPVVIERVIDDLDSGSNAVRMWQGYAVRVGILFTFIGLVIALGPIHSVLDTIPEKTTNDAVAAMSWFTELRSSIGMVVNGLAMAFGSSIVGLVSALFLQFVVSIVQRKESDVVEMLAAVAADVQYVFRRARDETPLARDIEALQTLLAQHKDELHASSRAINADVSALGTRLDGIATARDAVTALLQKQSEATERQVRLTSELGAAEGKLIALIGQSETALGQIIGRGQEAFQDVVARSATQFTELMENAIVAAGQRQAEADRSLVTAIQGMGASLIQEINGGLGRDARVALEKSVTESLRAAADAFVGRENRHAIAAERIARNVAYSFGFAVVAVIAAGAFTLIIQSRY